MSVGRSLQCYASPVQTADLPIVEVSAEFDHDTCQRGDQLNVGFFVLHERTPCVLVNVVSLPAKSLAGKAGRDLSKQTK